MRFQVVFNPPLNKEYRYIMAIIKHIDVRGLFGYVDVSWELESGVNILSGGNGSGKSTILRALGQKLVEGAIQTSGGAPIASVDIQVSDGELTPQDVVVVNRQLGSMEYRGAEAQRVTRERFELFCDVFDEFLVASPKSIDRQRWQDEIELRDLSFIIERDKGQVSIEFEWLSAGEQLALSLMWAVAERPEAKVLILDEPEISLSIEWQRIFLESILRLSPKLQVIVATHSPALIMCGWIDRVTEIDDIIKK